MQDQKNKSVRTGGYNGDYSCFDFMSPKLIRKPFCCSISGLLVFLLSFIFVPYFTIESSLAHADSLVSAGATWVPVSLELDPDVAATDAGGSISDVGHGDILFGEIHPTSVGSGNLGTEVVVKKTIGVTTAGKYYSVYLSTASDSNALAHTATNTESEIPAIIPTSGSASAFSDSSWGYALSSVVPTVSLGTELTKPNNSSIYNQDSWSPVPVLGSAVQVQENSTNSVSGFSSGDTFDIYYGIMIDTDVLAGTYENMILYTALASSDSLDVASKNITRDKYLVAEGETETLSFDLSASVSGNISSLIQADDISIYLVPHSEIILGLDASNNYTVTNAMQTKATLSPANGGYKTCTIASNSDLTITTDAGATVTCTMPDETPLGDNDGEGYYDFWLTIPSYGFNYISRYTENNQLAASVLYAGLQSKVADTEAVVEPGDPTPTKFLFTEMQEMTSAICKNTNRWNNKIDTQARILDYTGTTQIVADIMTTTTDPDTGEETEVVDGAATRDASNVTGIGKFVLTDNRDNKSYEVRRLADGGCWMSWYLMLRLGDFVGTENLTSANTDLNSKETWDPGKSMHEIAHAIDPSVTTAQNSYFPVASLDRLGVTQTYQYHGSDGPLWASYYYNNADGEKTKGTSKLNNVYAQMPRAYYYSSNLYYYNWYAGTAESGTYAMTSGTAPDSICPKNWQLPTQYGSKSLYNLVVTAYGISTSSTAARSTIAKFPIYIYSYGYYRAGTGKMQDYSQGGGVIMSEARSNTESKAINMYGGGTIGFYGSDKNNGEPVRCVAR